MNDEMIDDNYDFEQEQLLARDEIESQAFDKQGFRKKKANPPVAVTVV